MNSNPQQLSMPITSTQIINDISNTITDNNISSFSNGYKNLSVNQIKKLKRFVKYCDGICRYEIIYGMNGNYFDYRIYTAYGRGDERNKFINIRLSRQFRFYG